ncbi:MAG: hypothetical protein LBK91_00155, partial [Synergistaceae bacterium]|nr:hypothetical protein [Synergistaceae bacterium]
MSNLRSNEVFRRLPRVWKIAAVCVLAAFLALPAQACDCDEPVIIDGLEAYDRSLREGRDTVEGFWGIYLDW